MAGSAGEPADSAKDQATDSSKETKTQEEEAAASTIKSVFAVRAEM